MRKFVGKIITGFGRERTASLTAPTLPSGRHKYKFEEIPKYPPYNPGLPAVLPEQIIDSQSELMQRLQRASASNDAEFKQTYLAAVLSYAEFVHLLPASETHHHRGAGGLFRHGLEAGLYGAMHADRMMFVMDEPPSRRRELEPIWRFAAFLAAMNHDIGKPMTDLVVSDTSGERIWKPLMEPLYAWLERNKIEYYHIRYRSGRHQDHERMGALALVQVLPPDVKAYLSEGGNEILFWMQAAVANTQETLEVNPFRDLVGRADRDSVQRDLRINGALQSNLPSVGIAAERYVLDAIRRLLRSREWEVNKRGARVWMIDNNLYIAWSAARDIIRIISEDKIPGVPRDPDSIADMLIERDLVVARQSFNGPRRYWNIAPEILGGVVVRAVRLKAPDLVLDPPPGNTPGLVIVDDEEQAHETDKAEEVGHPVHSIESGQNSEANVEQPTERGKETPHELAAEENHEPQGCKQEKEAAPEEGIQPKKSIQSPKSEPKPVVPQEQNLFSCCGLATEVIEAIVKEIQDGGRASDQIRLERGLIVMTWPDAFQGFGMEPVAVLAEFEKQRLIDSDPAMPSRRVREGEAGKVVVLKHKEGMALLNMIKQAQVSQNPQTEKSAPPPQKQMTHQCLPGKLGNNEIIQSFINHYLAEGCNAPFPISEIENGVKFPIAHAVGDFCTKYKLKQADVKAALENAFAGSHPQISRVPGRSQSMQILRVP